MKEYKVESLKSEKTPAMVLLSEYSRRMAEMQAQFGGMALNEFCRRKDSCYK